MIRANYVLALAALMVATSAMAQDWPVYLGVSYGLAEMEGVADTGGQPITGVGIIESLPLDGQRFHDDEGSWSAYLGYEVNRYAALEAGYMDLGTYTSQVSVGTEAPSVDMGSRYLAGRFQYPLTDAISATWHLAVTETSFDVDGSLALFSVIRGPILGPNPGLNITEVPIQDIDDQTGYRWGFGFNWRFASRASTAFEFSRHDVQVFELDTFSVRMLFHL